MKIITITTLFLLVSINTAYPQDMNEADPLIAVDVAHTPIFWGDPTNTGDFDESRANRIEYLASQLENNAEKAGAELVYLNDEITSDNLEPSDMLFIHVPSSRYSDREVETIIDFLESGGSMFLATDVNYWVTLEQTNVNDLVEPFGFHFGADSPDEQVGALSSVNEITGEPIKIPYHGGRIVEGGTPFAFTVGDEKIPFAMFKELDGGGKIVVMGEAMTPLYMNSWQGVDDYQTEKFMQAVIDWLLN